jgi:hypothetical protein
MPSGGVSWHQQLVDPSVGVGLQVFYHVGEKGFLAPLVVEELKERSEIKRLA